MNVTYYIATGRMLAGIVLSGDRVARIYYKGDTN
jgi:hypothetical protein